MAGSNPTLCGSIAGRPGHFGVAMHNAAYRAMGLDYTYVAFGTDDTVGAMTAMRALGIRGLGVTMPHKIRIIEHLDAIDETAGGIGAVNTVVNEDGRLVGHNVDWIGAIRAFEEKTTLAGQRVAVIGAGGGARAIVYGLKSAGAEVSVFNRTPRHGTALAEAMGVAFAGGPEDVAKAGPFALLAHATPVGFHAPESALLPAEALNGIDVVFDAVPMPIETKLLANARSAGAKTIPGVRMQLHQAAAQFELYTGVKPEFAAMEQALLTAMGAL